MPQLLSIYYVNFKNNCQLSVTVANKDPELVTPSYSVKYMNVKNCWYSFSHLGENNQDASITFYTFMLLHFHNNICNHRQL
jgi:hypothetical protein